MRRVCCAGFAPVCFVSLAVLALLLLPSSPALGGPVGKLVQLTSNEPDDSPDADHGLLVRELMRQAVLIAARDEMGMPTRDASLREPFPDPGAALDMHTIAELYRSVRITLSRPAAADRPAFNWTKELAIHPGKYATKIDAQHYAGVDLAELAQELEPLTRHEFVDALRKAGFDGAPNKKNADNHVPGPIQLLLGDMSTLAQFDAVRRTHEEIRTSGESPALLGALVRGYANLGQFTSYYWSTAPKVFRARSLLYAQRMIAAAPNAPEALWARAYARAMAGLHAAALDDLAEAAKLPGGKPATPPHWVPLIEPYCRYQTGRLADIAANDKGAAPLAMLLCFQTVETCGSQSVVLEIGKGALQVDPESLRLIDGMNNMSGVSYGHVLSEGGTLALAHGLAARADRMPGLPATVRQAMPRGLDWQAWADPTAAAKFATALVDAGASDSAEPSWGTLGRMLQEENFANVRRRARFLADWLGVDASDYLRSADPLVAGHPYRNVLETYRYKKQTNSSEARSLLRDVPPDAIEFRMAEQWFRADFLNEPMAGGKPFVQISMTHGDETADEKLDLYLHTHNPIAIQELRVLSPHCPIVVASDIEHDWASVAPRAQQIEKEEGSHPAVAAALARKYIELNRPDDAERNLKRYLTRASDDWAYQSLANLYLQRGDEAQWLATMEASLKQEDYGLSHANVQVQIARHFMDKNEYAKAEPYAAAAAESWAGWAMECARDCYEGLGQWDKAEMWEQREFERYDRSPFERYFWCERTGHGDLKSARDAVDASLRAGDVGLVAGNATVFYLIEGRKKEALELMRSQFQRSNNPWQAMHAALLLDETGDAAGRDAMLKAAAESTFQRRLSNGQPDPSPEAVRQFARECQQLLAANLGEKTDPKDLVRYLPPDKPAGPTNVDYFHGKFFALHGQRDLAIKWFRHSLENRHQYDMERALAAAALRSMEPKSSDKKE